MNYQGNEKLRTDVAALANDMCEMHIRLRDLSRAYFWSSDVLVERLVDYEIIQYWIKAQRCTREWFGEIGERAIEHARYRLDLALRVENSYV